MKVLTLEPQIEPDEHDPVFINELKLSEFKQVLAKTNISSEFSGGVLWCSNGSIALRKVRVNLQLITLLQFIVVSRILLN